MSHSTLDSHLLDPQGWHDLSMPVRGDEKATRAWYAPPATFTPVSADTFVGSVAQGGSVNFRNIHFNPHAHGTHTECLGHITERVYSIHDLNIPPIMEALLVTVSPEAVGEDQVITEAQMRKAMGDDTPKALLVRSLPNDSSKLHTLYDGTNWPYFEPEVFDLLIEKGVEHFLTDLPSVDKEVDGGVLASHHRWWKVPSDPQYHRTITELIYVPNELMDGAYWLNLQVAPFENDAAPSRPIVKMRD